MSILKVFFCHFQISHLREEENRVRQLSGERGVKGGHILVHPNDRGQRLQLGHLRKGGSV